MGGKAPRLRGRTRKGRLAALDRYLVERHAALLSRTDGEFARAAVVDVGMGESPDTTLELVAALRTAGSSVAVIGVELDPQRAENARRLSSGLFDVRVGGLALPLAHGEPARLVRCMNVLRGGLPSRATEAHALLAERLLPDGILVEGTSDREGHVLVAHLIRRSDAGILREALLFHSDGTQGFAPIQLRDHLPRDLRRSVRAPHPLADFFSAWTASFDAARLEGLREPRATFARTAAIFAQRWPSVVDDPELALLGYLRWAPVGGVPLP